jgi:hypothetical protein
MKPETHLAQYIIKFEKGVKLQVCQEQGIPVIGYHCKAIPEGVNTWTEEDARVELETTLESLSTKYSTANVTKDIWPELPSEVRACILGVAYLSNTVIKPNELKPILLSLKESDESDLKDLFKFIREEQPHKLIQRLRKAFKQKQVIPIYRS